MDAKFGGLAQLALVVVGFVLVFPDPANTAPLALRMPTDIWRPIAGRPLPTYPARPQEQPNMSVLKPRRGDDDGVGVDDDVDVAGDDGGGDDDPVPKLKFRGMNLPRNFGAYDLDQNRGVSLAELAAVTETELKDAREPFEAADLDGNRVLSREEFTQAPWIFEAGGITLIDSAVEPGLEAQDAGAPALP